MTSEFDYRFTETALRDLDEVLLYISEELNNPTAAINLGRKILENIDTLISFIINCR